MNSSQQQPVLGEKPICPRHPKRFLHFLCTTTRCKYRVLCEDCVKEHEVQCPYHTSDVIGINDWYKAYAKLSSCFDPRENRQIQYQFEEMSSVFKKEKLELEKVSKSIDESFLNAINTLTTSIRELKEYYERALWNNFSVVYDDYKQLLETFDKYKKDKPKNSIFGEMRKEIVHHFKQGSIKDYFDKVYSGYYDDKVHNDFFNRDQAINRLNEYKDKLKCAVRKFQPQEFGDYWKAEIENFTAAMRKKCDTEFLPPVNLSFLSPKSPKLTEEDINHSYFVTNLATLQNYSSLAMHSVSEDTFVSVSEDRKVKIVNPLQNFRVKSQFHCEGEEEITSFNVLKFDLENNSAAYFLLLGGNDDFSSLEVWDTLNKSNLKTMLDAHDFQISVICQLKHEYSKGKAVHYVATGSADGFVKVWRIEIRQIENTLTFECDIDHVTKVLVHDDFISCMICLKGGNKYPLGVIISSSHDKSLVFWEWERQYNEVTNHSKLNGHLANGVSAPLTEVQIIDKYTKKIPFAHSDRINAVVALSDVPDLSDLEYFATGGGDGNIIIWDQSTRKIWKTIANKKTPVFAMEYLKKDRIACSANAREMKNFHVYIWNWKKSELLLSIREHPMRVQNIISLRDNIFASVDRGKNIYVWKIENWKREEEENCVF